MAVTSVAAMTWPHWGRPSGGRVLRDHPLGARTTYRVGGTASRRCLPKPIDEARNWWRWPRPRRAGRARSWWSGRGSNLLVADRGFPGWWSSLGPGFESLSIEEERVRAGAALSLPVLARKTAAAGLHGLEWAVGVPGSVGGAIRMNAGGHGSDTAATLTHFRWVDLTSGAVHEAPAERLGFAYRHSTVGSPPTSCRGRCAPTSSPEIPTTARRPSTRSCGGAGPISRAGPTPARSSPTRRGTRPAGSSRPAA